MQTVWIWVAFRKLQWWAPCLFGSFFLQILHYLLLLQVITRICLQWIVLLFTTLFVKMVRFSFLPHSSFSPARLKIPLVTTKLWLQLGVVEIPRKKNPERERIMSHLWVSDLELTWGKTNFTLKPLLSTSPVNSLWNVLATCSWTLKTQIPRL